jgi:endonuclease
MRLLVARCEVRYTGRLTAVLPEAVRLLILKADGSVLVHDDAGGFKPLNWMTGPTHIEELGEVLLVRKPKSEDVLEIRLAEILSDVVHDMGESAALQKGRRGARPSARARGHAQRPRRGTEACWT